MITGYARMTISMIRIGVATVVLFGGHFLVHGYMDDSSSGTLLRSPRSNSSGSGIQTPIGIWFVFDYEACQKPFKLLNQRLELEVACGTVGRLGLAFCHGVSCMDNYNGQPTLVRRSDRNTFRRIVRNRSTGEFDSLPYVVTLLNSSLWVYYGLTKPGAFLIVTVNGCGVLMEAIYVALFLIFAADPSVRMRTATFAAVLDVGVVVVIFSVTRFAVEESLRVTVIGSLCALLNIFMYGSPLVVLRTVITTRSVEYMPFLLSLFLFLNGLAWTIYAVIAKDVFIGIPNGIGFFLGTIQLILYMIYNNANASIQMGDNNLDEEWHNPSRSLIEPNGRSNEDEVHN